MQQTNVKKGSIRILAGDTLTGKEGYLVKIKNASGVAKAYLPEAVTDIAAYVVLEGAAAGSLCTIAPLVPDQQVRVVALDTTFTPGSKVIAYAAAGPGAASAYASGAAFIVGVAEETGDTAGQQLLIRPLLSYWTA